MRNKFHKSIKYFREPVFLLNKNKQIFNETNKLILSRTLVNF